MALPLVLYDNTQSPPRMRAAVPGDVADPTFLGVVHPQPVPALVWSVQHNLGTRRLDVTTFDESGLMIFGEPRWSSATDNQLFVDFCRPVSGTAVVRPL